MENQYLQKLPRVTKIHEVEELFKQFMTHRLTRHDNRKLRDVIEILRLPQHLSSKGLHGLPIGKSRRSDVSIYCLACSAGVAGLFYGVEEGLTDKQMEERLTWLCTQLGVQTHEVCKGAITLYIPILTYIIRNTPEAKPRTFCGLILQQEDNPDYCVYDDPRFEWEVILPKPDDSTVYRRRLKKRSTHYNQESLKVAFITDVHLDPLYKANGVAACNEPACCRGSNTKQISYKRYHIEKSIHLSKQAFVRHGHKFLLDLNVARKKRMIRKHNMRLRHVRKAAPAGYWGDYRNCDTPLWTYDNFIERIAKTHKDIDVVYYVGDTIDHHSWATTYRMNNRMNSYMVDKIRRTFGDKVLLVPAIGNHESQPINAFASEAITKQDLNTTWLYKSLAKKWDFYLPEKAKASFLKRGSYSVLVRPGLRVITLNTLVAFNLNWWQIHDPRDAKKHLDWLVRQLYKAELREERVHILTHVPPGEAELSYTWTREYNRIVNRFSSTIAAEFNGHTHQDEFRIMYNDTGSAVHVAWNGGGLTTFSNFNPNYKIFNFHPITFSGGNKIFFHHREPTHIDNYIFNMTRANLTPRRKPHWYRLYDFKQAFGLRDLSPASMNHLATRMVTTDKQLLDLYSDYFYKMSDAKPECHKECKLDELCRAVVSVLWEREKCEELKKLYG